ncbi:MAG: electron transfer flavoprotein subunit alpha/FixB family protein [Planctomycetota bacterium]|jgi:electron transfer flavoprotein alpha subunit
MSSQGVWILAEISRGTVSPVSFELLTRATTLATKRGTDVTALVFGKSLSDEMLKPLIECGADRVVAVEADELEHFLVEPYARAMLKVVEDYCPEIVIAAATSMGRTLMPYVAVKADAGLTADCTVLDIEEGTGNLLQTRPAIGGNILATIKTSDRRPQRRPTAGRRWRPSGRILPVPRRRRRAARARYSG